MDSGYGVFLVCGTSREKWLSDAEHQHPKMFALHRFVHFQKKNIFRIFFQIVK